MTMVWDNSDCESNVYMFQVYNNTNNKMFNNNNSQKIVAYSLPNNWPL